MNLAQAKMKNSSMQKSLCKIVLISNISYDQSDHEGAVQLHTL